MREDYKLEYLSDENEYELTVEEFKDHGLEGYEFPESEEEFKAIDRMEQEKDRLYLDKYSLCPLEDGNNEIDLVYSSDEYHERIEENIIEAFRCGG